ncbi:carbonic anhydrase / acetyltransferase family protein [Desulforapulum autotrophicum HRM2]|uniref:Carbonic anhydrase / acetyltransferase family protein n=1 Tax=Desulforapulum autotrophicum (strain ATCC 43914 / DSM 3382 / VKM B-1955 / HRM2) TaxID=177437 RepID=C0Q8Q8_DESAH|nr:gamma carbonic anhydrase family protein [Desulforapulum autotrophicum]ACN14398.1 carbonic anhydrase / acetyltransferase family protein [Desulforapulum autotrophicum HRM2]
MTLYAYKKTRPEIHETVFIAPTAQIIGNVHIGKHSSVWFQTVIRGDMDRISIGERTNIQDLSICHADENIPLNIGNGVTIGHNCVVHGCTIEDNCLIGMGAIVMNRAVVGTGSVIAAGAVVLEQTIIPPYSLVTGLPGKVKKRYENREEIEQYLKKMSDHYVKSARDFSAGDLFYPING